MAASRYALRLMHLAVGKAARPSSGYFIGRGKPQQPQIGPLGKSFENQRFRGGQPAEQPGISPRNRFTEFPGSPSKPTANSSNRVGRIWPREHYAA